MENSEKITIFLCLVLLVVVVFCGQQMYHYKNYIGKTPAELQQLSKSCESGDCVLQVVVKDRHRRVVKPLCSRSKK